MNTSSYGNMAERIADVVKFSHAMAREAKGILNKRGYDVPAFRDMYQAGIDAELSEVQSHDL